MSVVQKLASGTWRRYSADDGGYYFHNEENDQSVWDPPAGWVDEAPPGGGAMDSLGADGKTLPKSNSALSSVVADKPNRPSHTREASQDTTMSPGEVQSMKREAAGSSVSVTTPVVRSQPVKSSSYNQRDEEPRPLCTCCASCSFGCLCVGIAIFLIVAAIVVLATVLTLPQTVSCNSGDKGYFVVTYDGPNLTSVSPNIVCTSTPTNLTFTGYGFLKYNGDSPQVSLGSLSLTSDPDSLTGCSGLDVRKEDVQTCTGFTVELPVGDSNTPNAQLTITNPTKTPHPAAKGPTCTAKSTTAVLLVRAPNVTEVTPPGVCQNTVNTLTIVGGPFLQYQLTSTSDWVKPAINLQSSSVPPNSITPVDCTPYSLTGYNNASYCNQLVVELTASLYGASNVFQVQNPTLNGGCGGDGTALFRVIAPSTITSASPNALCWQAAPATTVTFQGMFLEVDGVPPTFTMDGAPLQNPTLSNCTPLEAYGHELLQCTTVTLSVTPVDKTGLGLTFYTPVFAVANGLPGCIGFSTPIATFPNPIIDAIPPALPAICTTNPTDQIVTISGSFLVFNSVKPSFEIGPLTLDPSRVNPVACNPINVPGFTVSLCTRFALTIPNATAISAPNPVKITYSDPLEKCSTTSAYSVFSANPPVLNTVLGGPISLSNLPVNLTLQGTFQSWNAVRPTVTVGTAVRTVVAATCPGTAPQTCSALIATITSSAGLPGVGNFADVVVTAGSCDSIPQQVLIAL